MIDVFIDYQDIWQDSDDVSWYRGPTDDALNGCVLVNPRLTSSALLVTKPLMSGLVSAYSYLKGIVEVKPNE